MGSISRQKLKKRKEKNVAFFKRRKKNGTFWTEKNAVPNPALNVLESLLQCFYCTILLHSVHLSDKYQPIHKVFLLSLSPFICPSPFSSSFSLISYLSAISMSSLSSILFYVFSLSFIISFLYISCFMYFLYPLSSHSSIPFSVFSLSFIISFFYPVLCIFSFLYHLIPLSCFSVFSLSFIISFPYRCPQTSLLLLYHA